MPEASYIHGTDPSEQARLAALNRMTNAPFLDFLNLGPADRVLEVGSGLGLLAAQAAARAPRGRVVGLEHSAAQLAAAPPPPANLSLVQGDAHALPFPDDSFDVAYCRYVLEHVADPVTVLAEMRRVVRAGGRVLAQENNIEINRFDPPCPAFERVWERFAQLQAMLGGDALIGRRLLRLFRGAGLRQIELSIQPEVHWSTSPGFVPWVTNLIGNVRSGEAALVGRGLASAAQVREAVAELQALMLRDDATAIFYWNRAAGVK
jgi:ubiquinone/menaquinone biosynthesis C-methylase UbiE